MEFRKPKCKCADGQGKYRYVAAVNGYVCQHCKTVDHETASPEDKILYDKIAKMMPVLMHAFVEKNIDVIKDMHRKFTEEWFCKMNFDDIGDKSQKKRGRPKKSDIKKESSES